MKLKLILSAALIAGVISAQAATSSSASAVAAGATNSPGVDPMTALFGDPVLAKGTGFAIKRSDVDKEATQARANAAASNQQVPPTLDAMVLNELITIQMLTQKATDADRAAGKALADEQYTNMLARFGSQDAFDRQLKIAGVTVQELRAKAAEQATAQVVLKRALKVTITPAQISDCYSNHEASFEEPEKVHAEHILLLTMDPTTKMPLSTNAVAAKRKQIEDLLKRIKGGEDFATLARQYSEDPGSKADGGELPKFARGQMVPEFDAAAFSLNPGQLSDIVTTAYGFHIIKVLDKTPAKKYGMYDVIPEANNLTPAKICENQLEADKLRQLAPAYVNGLRDELKVEITDPTLKEQSAELMAAATNAPAEN